MNWFKRGIVLLFLSLVVFSTIEDVSGISIGGFRISLTPGNIVSSLVPDWGDVVAAYSDPLNEQSLLTIQGVGGGTIGTAANLIAEARGDNPISYEITVPVGTNCIGLISLLNPSPNSFIPFVFDEEVSDGTVNLSVNFVRNCTVGNTYRCAEEGVYASNTVCFLGDLSVPDAVECVNNNSFCTQKNYMIFRNISLYNVTYDKDGLACMQKVNNQLTNIPEAWWNYSFYQKNVSLNNNCCGDDGDNDQFFTSLDSKYLCNDIGPSPSWNYSGLPSLFTKIFNDEVGGESVISVGSAGWVICNATGNSYSGERFNSSYVLSNFEVLSNLSSSVISFNSCPLPFPPCTTPGTPNAVCCEYQNLDVSTMRCNAETTLDPTRDLVSDTCFSVDESGNFISYDVSGLVNVASNSVFIDSFTPRVSILDENFYGNAIPSSVVQCSDLGATWGEYDVCDKTIPETCKRGRTVSVSTNNDLICCVGESATCEATTNIISCNDPLLGFETCGNLDEFPFLNCLGDSQIISDLNNNQILCCDSNDNCVVDEPAAIRELKAPVLNSFMCNEFDGNNFITECCNDYIECNNANLNNEHKYYSFERNVVSMGSSLNQIKSFDRQQNSNIISNQMRHVKESNFNNVPHELFQLSDINQSGFSQVEFFLFFKWVNISGNGEYENLSDVILQYYTGSPSTPLEYSLSAYSNKLIRTNTWLKITVPFTTSPILTMKLKFKEGVKAEYFVDEVTLTNPSIENQYCTPLSSWISDLDFSDVVADQVKQSGINTWKEDKDNFTLYIEHKWTCSLTPGFGWTGTKCCGDDQSILVSENYIDLEGGCWNGYAVDNKGILEKEIFGSNASGRVMYFNESFHECGYSSTINSHGLNLKVDDYCDNNINYFCDYGRSEYISINIDGKKRNTTKTVPLVNQLFDGDFNEK